MNIFALQVPLEILVAPACLLQGVPDQQVTKDLQVNLATLVQRDFGEERGLVFLDLKETLVIQEIQDSRVWSDFKQLTLTGNQASVMQQQTRLKSIARFCFFFL